MNPSMRLWIVRHGIAEAAHPDYPMDDGVRRLTDEGVRKTRRGAEGMRTLGVHPAAIWSSPHTRALQTAAILHEVLEPAAPVYEEPALSFAGSARASLEAIRRFEGPWPLMVVGHQPMLADLVGMLIASGAVRQRFRKAGLVGIDLHPIGDRLVGELQMMLPPRVLRAVPKSR